MNRNNSLRKFFVGRATVFIIMIAIVGILAGFKFLGDLDFGHAPQMPRDDRMHSGQPLPPIDVPDFEGEADPAKMTLEMWITKADGQPESHAWTWIYAKSADGKETRPAIGDEKKFTISFSPSVKEIGSFVGTTDCNSMQGKFAADHKMEISENGDIEPRAIRFTEVMRTEMACGDSQEAEFVKLIENAESYEFTSRGELILNQKGGGKAVFR